TRTTSSESCGLSTGGVGDGAGVSEPPTRLVRDVSAGCVCAWLEKSRAEAASRVIDPNTSINLIALVNMLRPDTIRYCGIPPLGSYFQILPTIGKFHFDLAEASIVTIVQWLVSHQVLRAQFFRNLVEGTFE